MFMTYGSKRNLSLGSAASWVAICHVNFRVVSFRSLFVREFIRFPFHECFRDSNGFANGLECAHRMA